MIHGAVLLVSLFLPFSGTTAQTCVPGRNTLSIRGQPQDLYFCPADQSTPRRGTVLFLPGDGGWRGFAIDIAQQMAAWGYDVYGLDTKTYLASFTGQTKSLQEADVTRDLQEITQWIRRTRPTSVTLVGWSEGAGLVILAAAVEKNIFSGVVALATTDTAVLGWRVIDDLTYLTGRNPHEPSFAVGPYLAKIAPLPIVMIQASRDRDAPLEAAKTLFALASEPKRLYVVDARNHRFDEGREEFFRVLQESLRWMDQAAR